MSGSSSLMDVKLISSDLDGINSNKDNTKSDGNSGNCCFYLSNYLNNCILCCFICLN